jgi:hypothetical protein
MNCVQYSSQRRTSSESLARQTLLDESTLEVRITVFFAEATKALALQVRPETSTEEYEQRQNRAPDDSGVFAHRAPPGSLLILT